MGGNLPADPIQELWQGLNRPIRQAVSGTALLRNYASIVVFRLIMTTVRGSGATSRTPIVSN